MLFSKWTLVVFFVILINYQVQPVALPVYFAVYNIMNLIIGKIGYSLKTGKPLTLFGSTTNEILGDLMGKVDKVSEKLDVMNDRIMGKLSTLEVLIKGIANDVQQDALMQKVVDPMKVVRSKYDELRAFAMTGNPPEKRLKTFLEEATHTGNTGLEEQLKKIHRAIAVKTGASAKDLLDVMAVSANSGVNSRCGGGSSPQHTIYSLYLSIIASELLGFTTIVYSYKLLEGNKTSDTTANEIKYLHGVVKKRIKDYSDEFVAVLERVPRDIRTCDPVGNHIRDETFTEMWGLVQGVLLYEYDLIHDDTCSWQCSNLNGWRYNKPCYNAIKKGTAYLKEKPIFMDRCSTPRKCFGILSGCHSLYSASYCALEDSTRRYQWVRDSKKTFGKDGSCNGTQGSLPQEVYGLYTCESCFCGCEDNEADSVSVHTVSLKESLSDTKNNKVIVGVRIKVHENILHLQVKESKICEQYQVDLTNVSWVDLPSMKQDVYTAQKYPSRSTNRFVKDRDFVKWQYSENVFNFDFVQFEYGRVATGVKFAKSEKSEIFSGHVEVQVQSMEYDSKTGKLKPNTERWDKSSNIHKTGLEYSILVGTESKEETNIDSTENMYSRVSRSDWWNDAGQTVLPLFDAQTVEAIPNAPLTGFGFHHRGTFEESGFFGLTVFSINFGAYIKDIRDSGPSDFANSTELEEPL